MQAFLRSKLVLVLTAVVLLAAAVAIPLVLSSSHSKAASPPGKFASLLTSKAASRFGPLPARPHQTPKVSNPPISINLRDDGRFLYVDDGACPDSIDAYRITTTGLVLIGNFPTGGCSSINSIFGGGSHDLDATPANGTHGPCLVYTDVSNGLVDSFPVLRTGALGAPASQLSIGSLPIDVHISQNGKLVYVDSLGSFGPPSILSSYRLGAGCVLTALSSLMVSNLYLSLALLSPTRLFTANVDSGSLDTYALTPSGGISLLNSVPGQLNAPVQVVSLRTRTGQHDVFTGQFNPGPPSAQGGLSNLATGAITFLNGSPASDPSGLNGESVYADEDHLLLVQGESGTNSLGVYKVTPGHPGSIAFLQHVPLDPMGGGFPVDFARMDNTLFVAAGFNGDVESCLIKSSGVSGCATAAVLTNPTGVEGGIVLL